MFTGFYYDQILEEDEALMKAKAEVVGDFKTQQIIFEEDSDEEPEEEPAEQST